MKSKSAYYKILEISPNANLDDIKSAYRRLAKVYHPDLNAGSEVAEEKFKQILEAYEALKDSKLQVQYPQYRQYTSTHTTPTQQQYPFEPRIFDDFSYSTTPDKGVFLEIFLTINFYLSIIVLLIAPFLPGEGDNTVYSLSGSSIILFLLFISQQYWLTGWFFGLLALFGWLPVTFGECSWKVGIFASAAPIGAVISAVITWITWITYLCFKQIVNKW
ncbi:MAG: J domain-containing protein [bacterium]